MWLGRDQGHYYILSRYLICRMLTVTKMKHSKVNSWIFSSWASPLSLAACVSCNSPVQALDTQLFSKLVHAWPPSTDCTCRQ